MNSIKTRTGYLTFLVAFILSAFALVLAPGCGGSQGRDPILGIGDFPVPIPVPDTIRPQVTVTVPDALAVAVPTSTKIIATFSEDMNPATLSGASGIANFTLCASNISPCPTPLVGGTVSYVASARSATFSPTALLAATTTYTATVTTGATDLAGNALGGNQAPAPAASNYVWTFTTGAVADLTPPTVTTVFPADLATGVCPNAVVSATFSEPMDPSTITSSSFTLQTSGPPLGPLLNGSVTYDAATKIASFAPSSSLVNTTTYTATMTTGVKDVAGNALASNKVWTFTAGPVSTCNAQAPSLLSAKTFGIIGGSAGMTNQGTLTVINGDIGTTAVSTAVTGFHDAGPGCTYTETGSNIGTVNGKIYTAAPPPTIACPSEGTAQTFAIAKQARDDAVIAYNMLAGLAGNLGAANLGGLTLAPGVYQAPAGTFMIQGADLTLDANGDANAVWVFQMATSLTVGGPGAAFPQSVTLINGAQAKNVYWQVGSAATINAGGGGTMVGTIIAQSGAAFSTAGNIAVVTLNGRALSLGASVTLVNTVINVPGP